MSESGITLPAFGGLESLLLWLVFAAGTCALAYGWWLIRRVLRRSPGPASMQAVAAAIAETGATSMKEMGAVMKAVMPLLAGKNADGKAVSEAVKKKLNPVS